MAGEAASASADHLAVLVHGLWGNPKHLKYVASTLREKYPEDELHILSAKRNAGSFTYDGIELGGERVAQEIEDVLEELARAGHTITKISMIGYSLGGLVARYAIGLLYHKGWFDKLEPVNFTTFATPHLGVRTPRLGYHNQLWNAVAARMLSESGRQLFTIDSFRDNGRPLLAVLADPSSIFIRGIARFKHRSLYANVVNDRTVAYYTAMISATDPFAKLPDVDVNYIPGYDHVIVDGKHPATPKDPDAIDHRIDLRDLFLKRIPLYALLGVVVPIALSVFSANALYQTIRSRQRIQLHEAGKLGIAKGVYRMPLLLQDVRQMGEDMYEIAANTQEPEYLPEGGEGEAESESEQVLDSPLLPREKPRSEKAYRNSDARKNAKANGAFPTLALTEEQFAMVEALDAVGFEKHPVYIHNHHHSHAGIIVRSLVKRFDEGKVVVRHWLDRFEI